jgi:hypothetical protein
MRVFLWINAQPCPQPQIALPWVFTPLREGEAPAEPNVSVQFSVFSNRRILPREGEAPAEPAAPIHLRRATTKHNTLKFPRHSALFRGHHFPPSRNTTQAK